MKSQLQKLFDEYITECRYVRNLRPKTIVGYCEVFKRFISVMNKVYTPEDLSRDTLIEFFQIIRMRKGRIGMKNSTIRTYWTKLHVFFEWLRIAKYINENPLLHIQAPEDIPEDRREIERNDINKIIAAISLYSTSSFLKQRDTLMIFLLLFCGLRRNELISLMISDVDMENKILTIRGCNSKSKKSRLIPINPTVHFHLQEYYKERKSVKFGSPYLIVSAISKHQLTTHGIKHWVNKIREMSGVSFHLHMFRHSFACNLARQNTSAIKIQRLLGHADLRTTERYVRSMTVEDFRQDINRMSIDNWR